MSTTSPSPVSRADVADRDQAEVGGVDGDQLVGATAW